MELRSRDFANASDTLRSQNLGSASASYYVNVFNTDKLFCLCSKSSWPLLYTWKFCVGMPTSASARALHAIRMQPSPAPALPRLRSRARARAEGGVRRRERRPAVPHVMCHVHARFLGLRKQKSAGLGVWCLISIYYYEIVPLTIAVMSPFSTRKSPPRRQLLCAAAPGP